MSFLRKYFPIHTCLIFILLMSSKATHATTIIHPPTANDPKESLVLDILKMALTHSSSGPQFHFQEFHSGITEARLVEMVKEGSMSVMWAGTQKRYEEELLPIRIPVLKGLLGHRIFIMRSGEQSKFDQINTLEQLRSVPLGQGKFWGDTAVLKENRMSVVAPVKYQSLFPMLEGGRFDLFPRAVHEPWSEVAARPELNLSVEKKLLLVYPFAMYFFVSGDNPTLAKSIESGFRAAINNGEFDRLFFTHPLISEALAKSDLKNRNIFRLNNPYMSPETPIDDTSLWLDIEQL